MRLAIKFGYDGRAFHGFSRQPGQRTVEGDIVEALRDLGIIGPSGTPRDIGYGAASRTDAGVSAIGNVLALDTTFRKDALLRALNARMEDIWFHSLAEVPDGFQPRHAAMRWYRYHLMTDEIGDWNALRKAVRLFVGEHDFTNFCRPEGKSAVRSIHKVLVCRTGRFIREEATAGRRWQRSVSDRMETTGFPGLALRTNRGTNALPGGSAEFSRWSDIAVDFFSQGFLWNQVRRMVGAALRVSRGELKLGEVKRALDNPKKRADLGLAPAGPLILMDVAYDFDFEKDDGALGLAARSLQKKRREAIETMVLVSYLKS